MDDMVPNDATKDRHSMLVQECLGFTWLAPAYRWGEAHPVVAFLKAHLYDEEVVITDTEDNMIFHARDGIDLHSELGEICIDLRSIYQEIRRDIVVEGTGEEGEREPCEDLYDSVGLFAQEVRMRQIAKKAAKAVTTVSDVTPLLEGTYFDAFFETEDGRREWGYFNKKDYSAHVTKRSAHGGWRQDGRQFVTLRPEARVRHKRSSEDVPFSSSSTPQTQRTGS